jgi:putative ABC transport system permease protein
MSIYRRLLRIAAPALAREYGPAMEETLATRWREARGVSPRTRIVMRELLMLIALAWSERFGSRVRAQRRQQRLVEHSKAGAMDTLGQELRQAARRLLRAPAFTVASVLTLGLAIGANTAIFALVQRVVVNPLPYPESDRLIELDHGSVTMKVASGMSTTPGIYFIYRDRARSIESAAVYSVGARTLIERGEPERLRAAFATPSLGAVLRVPPALGRWFTEEEGTPGGPLAAVLSHSLWTWRFNGDRSIIGRGIVLDGVSIDVIGVMPAGFAFPDPRIDVWLPTQISRAQGFGFFGPQGVARLRDGVSLDTARAEFQGLLAGIADAYPDDPKATANVRTKLTFVGRTLKDATLGNVTRGLWLILAAVGVVLFVACANVANLFLVRTELRQREVAIRRALGAARLGLGRYFFTESFLLAGAGGAIGLSIAWAALRVLVQAGPTNLPRLHEVRLDAISVAYVAAVSIVAALVFGSIPLWRGTAAGALHDSGRGNTTSRQRHYVRHLLLGAQVAMALVLLVASALMVRSFQNLHAIDPGFNPDSTLSFNIGLPRTKYITIDQMATVHNGIVDRLAALPGVESASATTCLPLSMGCNANSMRVEGEEYPHGTLPPLSLMRAVGGGYFETMGMRIVRGRAITRADVDRKEPVVVISQKFANIAFKDVDPIGRRIASNQPPKPDGSVTFEWWTIVGVVVDTPMRALNEPDPMPMTFMPLSLANGVDLTRIAPTALQMNFVVRTSTPPLSIGPLAREAVRAIDADLAIAQFTTLQALVDRASAQMTFTMVLLAAAASISLVLGMIGIYGVTSYIVSQRTSEIGVRLALGAEPAGITSQIVKQGGKVTLAGIAVGLLAASAGSRLIASVLYGVSPRDPAIFAAMATLLMLVALVACWIPARRAARLSPTIALRAD